VANPPHVNVFAIGSLKRIGNFIWRGAKPARLQRINESPAPGAPAAGGADTRYLRRRDQEWPIRFRGTYW